MDPNNVSSEQRIALLGNALQMIRHTDDLQKSWVQTLMAMQGAAAIAVGTVWKELPIQAPMVGLLVGSLAVLVTALCVYAAIRELQWQGHYCAYAKELDPTGVLFQHLKVDLTQAPKGVGKQAKMLIGAAIVLGLGWSAVLLFSFKRWT
jgi:hypothetical protein